MKMAYLRITIVFFLALFVFGIFRANTLAAGNAEWGMIKKLEEEGRRPYPEIITRPQVTYTADGLRDPFKKPVFQESKKPGDETPVIAKQVPALTVQGLVWGGKFPQAIINNKVVKLGDTIDGATITSINKAGITVLFEGAQYDFPAPAASALPSQKPGG